jgi:hypothetical protein
MLNANIVDSGKAFADFGRLIRRSIVDHDNLNVTARSLSAPHGPRQEMRSIPCGDDDAGPGHGL